MSWIRGATGGGGFGGRVEGVPHFEIVLAGGECIGYVVCFLEVSGTGLTQVGFRNCPCAIVCGEHGYCIAG